MRKFTMVVSELDKAKGERVEIGKVQVFYPLLSELGISVEPAKYDLEGKEAKAEDVEAFPVYQDEKVQYVFDAVLSAVKAKARNCLMPKSVTLRDGTSIPETVEELLSTGNAGEAMANQREATKAFAEFCKTSGKSEKLQSFLVSLFGNAKAVVTASAKRTDQLEEAVGAFANGLTADQVAKFSRHLVKLEEAINTARELQADEEE